MVTIMAHKDTKRLVLLFIAVISILFLIFVVIRLCYYSLSTYNQTLNTQKLKEYIGDASLTLTTDEATGRPITTGETTRRESDGILTRYTSLYDMNNDLIGWISIDDTRIDYPVMQTVFDEEYYLHRDFNRKEATEGLPFMDYRCMPALRSTNLIIYGHNMKNGDMFADLLKYADKSYYEKHRYIRFDTIYDEGLYEVIAVFRTRVAFIDENTFRFYNFIESDSEKDFQNYIDTIKSMSIYDIDATAISSDNLITLSTCEYSVEDGRFVVVARKIADKESPGTGY